MTSLSNDIDRGQKPSANSLPVVLANDGGGSSTTNPIFVQDPDAAGTAAVAGTGSNTVAGNVAANVIGPIDTSGYTAIAIQVVAAGSGVTITYECSNDNATYYPAYGFGLSNTNGFSNSNMSTSTVVGVAEFPCSARYFRARISTTGTSANVTVSYALRRQRSGAFASVLQGSNGQIIASSFPASDGVGSSLFCIDTMNMNMAWNGASWDRIRGTATGGIWAQGNVASLATDSGNPVKIGGVYNTSLPSVTNGQRVDLQVDSNGRVFTAPRSLLQNTGSSNGSIIAPLSLMGAADLNALASGSAVTSTAGAFNQTNTGSGQYGLIYFQTVTAGFTPTAGGNISIWFLFSPDGGTTYETTPATASTTVPALPRPPDCIIPLDAAALGTSAVKVSLPCKLPYGTFKVLVQNNSGAAFGAGNYTLKLVAFADNN